MNLNNEETSEYKWEVIKKIDMNLSVSFITSLSDRHFESPASIRVIKSQICAVEEMTNLGNVIFCQKPYTIQYCEYDDT